MRTPLEKKQAELIEYYTRYYTPLRASISRNYSPAKARTITRKLLKEIKQLESAISQLQEGEKKSEPEDELREELFDFFAYLIHYIPANINSGHVVDEYLKSKKP
jgi:hypothetical protein